MLDAVDDALGRSDGGCVAAGGDLTSSSVILSGGWRVEAGVAAVPERNVMRAHDAVDRISQVLGLQIRELGLLLAQLHIEQVVIDLGHDRLQRHRALPASRVIPHAANARLLGGTGWDVFIRGVLEEPRGMPRSRHTLDPLTEHAAAADNVSDLRLIQWDFDGARSDVLGRCVNLDELSLHDCSLLRVESCCAAVLYFDQARLLDPYAADDDTRSAE